MNLLPKGAKTFAALIEKYQGNGGGEDEEDEDGILPSALEQRFEGQILIGIEPLGRVMAKFYRS